MFDSFEVNTFRFIRKPLDIGKLYRALDGYFERYGNDYPLQLKVDRDTICIKTNDIIFLEADNKRCYIHLIDKIYHCSKTMALVYTLVPKNIFLKTSKAFIVNLNYISRYDNEFIYFKSGDRAPVGRKYFTPFKEAFRHFSRDYII